MTTTKEQIRRAREDLRKATDLAQPVREETARILLAATAEHERAETFEDVLVLLLREADPVLTGDVLRAKSARELADLVYGTVTRERRETAVMRGALRADAEILQAGLATEKELRARIAELEARLAGPTQEQRDDEADMLAFMVGG